MDNRPFINVLDIEHILRNDTMQMICEVQRYFKTSSRKMTSEEYYSHLANLLILEPDHVMLRRLASKYLEFYNYQI